MIGTLADSFAAKPTRLPDGLTMYLDAAEWIQLEILIKGSTEPSTLALIEKLVAAGDCVIDVGAHVGHHALVAARAMGATGSVYAFDPQPYNADRIAQNAELNGLTHLRSICAAVGNEDGFISLPLQSGRDRARLSVRGSGPNDLSATVEVPIRRLDTFMMAHDIPGLKLLKIDAEGYELEILRGLGAKIGACHNIILEVLDGDEGDETKELVRLLRDAGFRLSDVHAVPWQPGMDLPERNLWAARE